MDSHTLHWSPLNGLAQKPEPMVLGLGGSQKKERSIPLERRRA